jgi:S1-C subfamily serine protease
VLLAGSLLFGMGGVGDESPRLTLHPLATFAPRVLSTAGTNPSGSAAGDRPYLVGIDAASSTASQSGNGVVVASDGHIVTTAQLVEGASALRVALADGTTRDATVLALDDLNDLAVVKVDATGLAPAPLFDQTATPSVAIGDQLWMIGGSRGTRSPAWPGTLRSFDASVSSARADIHGALQLDARLDASAAGAALVDSTERVLGLVTMAGEHSSGTAYVVPARTVQSVASQFVTAGDIRHGWLGVEGVTASDTQTSGAGQGAAVVRKVVDNSPAESAGLRTGDLVVALDNRQITTMTQLVLTVREHRPGDRVTVDVIRDNARVSVQVSLADSQPATLAIASTTSSVP